MGVARWARPDQTTGYFRGVARNNTQEKGSGMGAQSAAQAWHPTVRALLLLVVVELVCYGALRSVTKHGG
jgi:hypothetical protein